jgi:hypothetical protein
MMKHFAYAGCRETCCRPLTPTAGLCKVPHARCRNGLEAGRIADQSEAAAGW